MRKMCILVPLLLFLSPACGHLWDFKFYTDSNMMTWGDALAFCREHHTDLVRIRNDQDQVFVSGWGWIGLYREDAASPWKWSRGDEIANFTMWDGGYPKSDGNCVFRYWGKWRTGPCDKLYPFTCYDEKLILVKENKMWEEALDHCRSQDTGDPASPYWNHQYDLATLITPYDRAYARERAQEATTDEVWMGLQYLAGEWLWVGGEQMQYNDISNCPAEGFCGVLEKNGNESFRIRNCQLQRNFFCYKKP